MKKLITATVLFTSLAAVAQITGTSFEEPALFSGEYMDTGDANVPHPLINNTNEPLVNHTAGNEIGFNARYVPYDIPGDGLTDGDLVGVTDESPSAAHPYPDGLQGYQLSDIDGNFILEFDSVDLTGGNTPSVSLDYFISETGYEGDGTVNASGSDRLRIYVKDLTNTTEIDILDTTGSDINDLMIEGSWITGTAVLLPDTVVQLVIEARTNSAAEAFYFDNVVFGGILEIKDPQQENSLLYPNPASSGYVNISSAVPGKTFITIFDVLGKEVLNTSIEGGRLDISDLKSGLYLARVTRAGTSVTKKLVVK